MLVAHNTCTIYTLRHQHLWCAVIIQVFYLQDQSLWWACYHGDVVRAQELLSIGANINYHYKYEVSYSAHITPTSGYVAWVSIHCTDTTSVRSLWFTLDWYVDFSHWCHTSKAPPVKYTLYMPWELIYPFDVQYMPWACNQHINTLYSGYY